MAFKVESSKEMTEEEALALIASSMGKGSKYDNIKNEISKMFSAGQKYGLVSALGENGGQLPEEEAKKAEISIGNSFKHRNQNIGVRYVPYQKAFVFAPLNKINEMAGK